MKKNFLKVAALLIAAMLLVVSCSQEVAPKTENNGLVEARLNVAYGRDLTVTGDTKQDDFKLYYKMEPGWTLTGATEPVYGGTKQNDGTYDFNELSINPSNGFADLGYVTPGLWKITVVAKGHNGSETENSRDIFTSGETGVYFNDTTKHATLFLTPVASNSNTLQFDFKMQALSDANNNGDYVVEYKYYKDGGTYGIATEIPCTGVSGNVATYTLADPVSIVSGYYTVNVSIYRKAEGAKGKTLVGGVTKGFLASGGATVTIGGNIQPSDYEKVSINAYYVKVNTSIATNPTVTYYKGAAKQDGSSDPNYAKITAIVTDSTNSTTIGSGYTVTYLWSVVSDGEEKTAGQTNSPTFTFTVENGGIKTITCTTIYSILNSSTTDDPNDKVYFANTVSKQVEVDPQRIDNATTIESTSNS